MDMIERLLFITSRNFGGGIVFAKENGQWIVVEMPPYLRKVLCGVPATRIGEVLSAKGFKHQWV